MNKSATLRRGGARVALALLALLAGCAVAPPGPRLDHSYTARGQSDRVKFIVLHYTAGDLPRSLKTLTQDVVSSHYLLTDGEQPFFYALVDESRQANHAGVSNWKAYTQLNVSSISIEIVNSGFRETPEGRLWYPFPQAQIDQLIPLLKQIMARHNIPPENVLGHSDIAPQRKQDPGPLFPWKQLADAGLVRWPSPVQVAARQPMFEAQLPAIGWFQQKLAQHGYAVPQTGELDAATRNVLEVFQSKYRQTRFDGEPDAETAAILDVLTSPALPVPLVPPAKSVQPIQPVQPAPAASAVAPSPPPAAPPVPPPPESGEGH